MNTHELEQIVSGKHAVMEAPVKSVKLDRSNMIMRLLAELVLEVRALREQTPDGAS
jgi:hypothetical protein